MLLSHRSWLSFSNPRARLHPHHHHKHDSLTPVLPPLAVPEPESSAKLTALHSRKLLFYCSFS